MRYKIFIPIYTAIVCCMLSQSIFAVPARKSSFTILEVVIFHVDKQYNASSVRKIAGQVTPVLRSYPGFISRKFARSTSKQNEWIDVVTWRSLQAASMAAQQIVATPQMRRFMAIMQDYKMYHFRIMSAE